MKSPVERLVLGFFVVGFFTLAAVFAYLAVLWDDMRGLDARIGAYLMANPEVILKSVAQLERGRGDEARRQAIAERRDEIFANPDDPVLGNPDGDVTLVEFLDYQCGYCKRVHPVVKRLLSDDPGVRLVIKEYPILGDVSTLAATAALASRAQGLYGPFSDALMGASSLDEDKIFTIAAEVGLDVKRLKADMRDDLDTWTETVTANRGLASDLGITGTPAFIAGDTLAPGAVDLARLKSLVGQARQADGAAKEPD